MQKDFFQTSVGGPPSSITMTSVGGRMSGMKRDVSHTEDNTTVVADDAVSTTSGVMREKEIKDSASKV